MSDSAQPPATGPPGPPGPPPVAPGPDVSIIGQFLGTSIFLYTVAITLVVMRIMTRLRPTPHMGWDDAAVILALIAAGFQIGFLYAAIPHGFGRHNFYSSIEDQIETGRLLLVSQFPWGWGVAFGKISIALLLMRFKRTVPWKIFLWIMIIIQVLSALTANIIQLAQCRPIEASWNPMILMTDPNASCWDPNNVQASVYVMGAIAVVTDVAFALIPITFLRKVQRPLREKIVLGLLMGIGVFSAAAVIVKLTYLGPFGKSTDPSYDIVPLATWSVVEMLLGIIAACVPTLKSPFEKLLRRTGLLSTSRRTGNASGYINAEDPKSGSNSHYLSDLSSKKKSKIGTIAGTSSEQSILEPTGPARMPYH
ncbi:hypothetical protein V8F20_006261 [Naviculisporaceae sp. PSN 640]